jgi:hypothetical protein
VFGKVLDMFFLRSNGGQEKLEDRNLQNTVYKNGPNENTWILSANQENGVKKMSYE